MTDALTIFGKPFSSGHHGHVRHGILKLSINGEYGPEWTTKWRAKVNIVGEPLSESDLFDDNAQARDWLESEVRRIMRECFEIAGELEAVKEFGSDNGGACYAQVTPVRFRDG